MKGSPVKDQVADHAKDWLTLALTGLGVTYAPQVAIDISSVGKTKTFHPWLPLVGAAWAF